MKKAMQKLSKSKKSSYITFAIIVVILIVAIVIISWPKESTNSTAELTKCIAQHSTLYVQKGCIHCQRQEEMFGSNAQYLNKIDCYYQREKCGEISGTPTWIINQEQLVGVQSIEKLKQVTGC